MVEKKCNHGVEFVNPEKVTWYTLHDVANNLVYVTMSADDVIMLRDMLSALIVQNPDNRRLKAYRQKFSSLALDLIKK